MGAERIAVLHRAIAETLEASADPDVEFLASHFRAAGDASRAAKYAMLAGDEALRTFAFDRAASWYEQAFELYPVGHAARHGLQIKLGDVLALAGRGARAAMHFEQAAADAPPMLALELRRRVAEQLLTSGHFDRGLEASRRVLSMIGMHLPSTRIGTRLSLTWLTILLRLRGLRFQPRPAERVDATELVRIDTCWSLAKALAFADTMVGFVFSQRALRLALRAGDVERIVSPLAMSATFHFLSGAGSRRGARMLKLALHWSHRKGTIHNQVVTGVGVGLSRLFRGEFRQATHRFLRALRLAQGSHGLVFQRVALKSVLVESLAMVGRYRELCEYQREALRDAHARSDVYAMARMQVGAANLSWLVEDRPDLAQAALESFARAWWPHGYHREHYLAHMAQVSIHLYTGAIERAYDVACEFERRTRASLLWRIQLWRLQALHAHGITALALLERGLGDRAKLLELVSKQASAIERERKPWMQPFADLLWAGLYAHQGHRVRAIERLTVAERALLERGLMGYAVAARERRARLRNDSTSEIESAHAWFRRENVQRPDRLLAVLAPGL
jgi:tetratricopeptide (TPR) repeat protein